MARKRKTQKRTRPNPGAIRLFVAVLLAGFLGLIWKDYLQVPFGLLGSIVWVGALLIAFSFGLLFYARFILPIPGNEGWTEGLYLLLRHYSQQANRFMAHLVTPPPSKRHELPEPTVVSRYALPQSLETLGAGMVPSHLALSLAKGTAFSRAAGPGFVILYRGEEIEDVIDLRDISRQEVVQAHTRDGIPVETAVSLKFHVRRDLNSLENFPYPYDSNAIFSVTHIISVDERNRDKPWTEQLIPHARDLVLAQFNQYTLDELLQTATLDLINNQIRKTMADTFGPQGIEIISASASRPKLPQEVTEQRLKVWQAYWQHKIQEKYTAIGEEMIRRIKQTKARIQIEIIQNIVHNIEAVRQTNPEHLTEIITLRMIEAMEEAASDNSVQALIPQPVMSSLVEASRQMLTWISQQSKEEQE